MTYREWARKHVAYMTKTGRLCNCFACLAHRARRKNGRSA
jgi:hypothetical protein